MAVYSKTKTYHTARHMGMIDVTKDFKRRLAKPVINIISRTVSLQALRREV